MNKKNTETKTQREKQVTARFVWQRRYHFAMYTYIIRTKDSHRSRSNEFDARACEYERKDR